MFRERTIVATAITSVIMIRINRMKRIVGHSSWDQSMSLRSQIMWKRGGGAIPTLKLKKVKYTGQHPNVNWEAC